MTAPPPLWSPIAQSASARTRCTFLRLNGGLPLSELQDIWRQPIPQLSCELEGHPLGGGMLKLEPREAGNVLLTAAWFAHESKKTESPRGSTPCEVGDTMAPPPFPLD